VGPGGTSSGRKKNSKGKKGKGERSDSCLEQGGLSWSPISQDEKKVRKRKPPVTRTVRAKKPLAVRRERKKREARYRRRKKKQHGEEGETGLKISECGRGAALESGARKGGGSLGKGSCTPVRKKFSGRAIGMIKKQLKGGAYSGNGKGKTLQGEGEESVRPASCRDCPTRRRVPEEVLGNGIISAGPEKGKKRARGEHRDSP